MSPGGRAIGLRRLEATNLKGSACGDLTRLIDMSRAVAPTTRRHGTTHAVCRRTRPAIWKDLSPQVRADHDRRAAPHRRDERAVVDCREARRKRCRSCFAHLCGEAGA